MTRQPTVREALLLCPGLVEEAVAELDVFELRPKETGQGGPHQRASDVSLAHQPHEHVHVVHRSETSSKDQKSAYV